MATRELPQLPTHTAFSDTDLFWTRQGGTDAKSTLADLKTEMIDSGTVLSRSTLADLKTSTDISAGNIVKTLGRNSVGDYGGATYEIIVPAGVPDDGFLVDLPTSGLYARATFGSDTNIIQWGAVADGDVTESGPYTSTDNKVAIKNCIEYILGLGEGRIFVPPGHFRIETLTAAETLTIWGHVKVEFYGAGPEVSVIYNSKGGTNSIGTCLTVGRAFDIHNATYGTIPATLGELDALDYTNINTSGVSVHDIGFGMPTDKITGGNQGLWMTNAMDCIAYNLSGYGVSNVLSIGNDNDESCTNIAFSNIKSIVGGRWYLVFIGASQHISGSDMVVAEGRSPALNAVTTVKGRFVTLSNITVDGRENPLFGNRAGGLQFHSSEHCSATNIALNNTLGDGVTFFRKLVLPASQAEVGPTWHAVANVTLKNVERGPTVYTEENVISGVTADRATILQDNPAEVLTLGQAGEGFGISCTATTNVFSGTSADVGRRITEGTSVAVIASISSSNPAATLTLSQETPGTGVSCTAAAPTFHGDSRDINREILESGGRATITAFNTTTSCTVTIIDEFVDVTVAGGGYVLTDTDSVIVDIKSPFADTTLDASGWTYFKGSAIDMKTNADNNTIHGSQTIVQTKYISETGTPRGNLFTKGFINRDGFATLGRNVRFVDNDNTGETYCVIERAFGTSAKISAGSSGIIQLSASNSLLVLDGQGGSETFYPNVTNLIDLGRTDRRWKKVWSVDSHSTNPVTNDSDERLKVPLRDPGEALMAVCANIKWREYEFLAEEEVTENNGGNPLGNSAGRDTRTTFGVGAQSLIKAFEDEGLDWQDYFIVSLADDGTYNINYTALNALEHAYIREQNLALQERVESLEDTLDQLINRLEVLENGTNG